MSNGDRPARTVLSPLGQRPLDGNGAPIGAARIRPEEAYGAIPQLLKEYIDTGAESAWNEIRSRIDKVYSAVSCAIESLEVEEHFSGKVLDILGAGKKLLFKPNLVELPLIDPATHGPMLIGTATPWEFMAAVMRWFHDRLGISYHRMTVGEAGTATSRTAFMASNAWGGVPVTTEAVLEGRCGDNYGGWGFYFARKYLADCHESGHGDDPLKGYEDSLAGACLPPGEAGDRLMMYDLNKVSGSNSRDVPVPDGINFKSITIHKAVVGGDPDDPEDMSRWPGCLVVNVCKLKIHTRELFTCSIKNLGIGFYPMEASASTEPGRYRWKYSVPNVRIPMVKMGIPHARWIPEVDKETGDPIRDGNGNYKLEKTGGLQATIADSVQAVRGQGVMMLHVADAIETANVAHIGPACTPVPEGFVFAATDMVAMDTCVSRYLFSMVTMERVDKVRKEHGLTSDVIQEVPMPVIEGKNIVSGRGYDSPYSRCTMLKHCESRGLGRSDYYVAGKDLAEGGLLASAGHRLGRVDSGVFSELLTKTLYNTSNKPLWDLQATCLAYLRANDKLTGSDYLRRVMDAFDEDSDGVIDYSEVGKHESLYLVPYEMSLMTQRMDQLEKLKLRFLLATAPLKKLNKEWNPGGHDSGEESLLMQALRTALTLSRAPEEAPDPFFPEMTWGKGKWPSMQFAIHRHLLNRLYGPGFPDTYDITSPFGTLFRYADAVWNGSSYGRDSGNHNAIGSYHRAIAGGAEKLPYTFYVPKGLGHAGNGPVPNVEETDDPALTFTASFEGKDSWRVLRLSEYSLE